MQYKHRTQTRPLNNWQQTTRRLTPLLLLLTLAAPVTSSAQSCQPLIDACRVAIKAHDQSVVDSKAALEQEMRVATVAQQRADSSEAKLQTWYHNPFFVSALGFFVGAATAGYVLKK